MKKGKLVSLIVGLALIVLAVLYLGGAMDWWTFSLFFRGWWTLFLIVPGVLSIANNGPDFGNVFLTALGVLLLLFMQGVILNLWTALLVAALAIAGVSIVLNALGIGVFPGRFKSGAGARGAGQSDDANPVFSTMLSGLNVRCTSPDLKSVRVSVVLGGAEVDLRDSGIHEDIVVVCEAVLGGIDLFLPQNVRVAMTGTPVLGGNECRFRGSSNPSDPLVTVACTSVLGGVEIK